MPSPKWLASATSALKRFGEQLLRRAETDERLARAIEQGYDLGNPVLHGTNKVLPDDERLRHLFATPEPGQALNYTGGGRRAGPGKGMVYPLVLRRDKVIKTPYTVAELVPYDKNSLSWLRELGINDPEEFNRAVHNKILNDKSNYYPEGWRADDDWGLMSTRNGTRPYDSKRFYEFLDSGAFRDALLERNIKGLEFSHPYAVNNISPKGRVLSTPETESGTAILINDPAIARSPWAQFLEQGIGLSKARGGLVQYKDCGCGRC